MALTPEDVVNKRFQSTKFREGYDQDEVDDFLDEVVVEPVAAPVAAVAATPIDETAGTTNLLQLARRLHEEHVKEGAEKRDALIAEGHATAARVIAEAETQQRVQLQKLDQERSTLEGKIDELRTFEREYRLKLKNYIEGQLHDLDASSVGSAADGGNASKSSFQGFGA